MKMKPFLALLCAVTLSIGMTGCGSKTENDTKKDTENTGNSQNAETSSEGVAYATAYLDCYLKGDVQAFASLSGQSEEDLQQLFADKISEQANQSLGGNEEAPGSGLVPPEIYQNTVDLWTKVAENYQYKVTAATETDDGYTLSVETSQMKLYTAAGTILLEKMASGSSDEESPSSLYAQQMADSYQEAFKNVTYGDPETYSIPMKKDGKNYTISEEDMEKLQKALLDSDSSSESIGEDPENLGEAAPNTIYPDDLDTTASYKPGDPVDIQDAGHTVGCLTIDKVEVTDDRADYNETTPDKVVVITYTYQNLSYDEPMLYDQMSFRLLEGKQVCDPYYLESLRAPELAEKGGSAVTASIAYGVSADCRQATIYVEGIQIDQSFQVTVDIP